MTSPVNIVVTFSCNCFSLLLSQLGRNKSLFDKDKMLCRSFERTMPIPFKKILITAEREEFFRKKSHILSLADNSCLPDIIRMGRDLTYEKLQKHSDFFAERLQGLPGRLASTYSIYRYFAHEVRTYKCTDRNISVQPHPQAQWPRLCVGIYLFCIRNLL